MNASYYTSVRFLVLIVAALFTTVGVAPATAQVLYVLGDGSPSSAPSRIKAVTYGGQTTETYTLSGRGHDALAFDNYRDPNVIFTAWSNSLASVNRVSLVDGTVTPIIAGYNAISIASDPIRERIYFGVFSGAIFSTNYDGTDLREVYPTPSGVQNITAMTLDPIGGWLYWAASRDIRRLPLDGGPAELIVGPTSPGMRNYFPYDIALDLEKGHLLWSEWDTIMQGEIEEDGSGRIMRSNLDGSNPQVVLQDYRFDDIPGVPEIGINPKAFAIDPVAGILFAENVQDGTLVRFCLDGTCYDDDFAHGIGIQAIDMAVIPAVPEPSTLALAGGGVVVFVVMRFRRRACGV